MDHGFATVVFEFPILPVQYVTAVMYCIAVLLEADALIGRDRTRVVGLQLLAVVCHVVVICR